MATRTITCEDCSRPYDTVRTNTKVCPLCRFKRDLNFVNDRTTKCWQDDKRFAPIRGQEKTCADCMYEPKKFGEAECGFCHEMKLRVHPEVNVCNRCARDPKKRAALIKAVARKVKEVAAA